MIKTPTKIVWDLVQKWKQSDSAAAGDIMDALENYADSKLEQAAILCDKNLQLRIPTLPSEIRALKSGNK